MFDGEFTHQGELCSFEVLLQRFELTDAALRPISELIHDVENGLRPQAVDTLGLLARTAASTVKR